MARPVKRGYLASVLGAVAGAVALGLTGVFVALVLANNATSNGSSLGEVFGDLFGIVVVGVLLAVGGLWFGAPLGCWLGLKVAGHHGQARTAVVLAILLPLWAVGLAIALNAVFGEVPAGVVGVAVAATAVGAPITARYVALREIN